MISAVNRRILCSGGEAVDGSNFPAQFLLFVSADGHSGQDGFSPFGSVGSRLVVSGGEEPLRLHVGIASGLMQSCRFGADVLVALFGCTLSASLSGATLNAAWRRRNVAERRPEAWLYLCLRSPDTHLAEVQVITAQTLNDVFHKYILIVQVSESLFKVKGSDGTLL